MKHTIFIFLILINLTLSSIANNPQKVYSILTKSNNVAQNNTTSMLKNELLPIGKRNFMPDSIKRVKDLSFTVDGLKSANLTDKTISEDTIKINIVTPGTLLTVLGADRLNVTNLKISGSLNGTDIFNINTKLTLLKYLDLWDVSLPDNKISDNAFKNNKTLTWVTLPKMLTSTGVGTFYGCMNLVGVINSNLCTEIGSSSFYGSSLTNTVIGDNITTIGSYAFYNCSQLEEIVFSNKVVSIGESAFNKCAISSLSLPKSLNKIGNYAFGNCENLKIVKMKNPTSSSISLGGDVFNDLGVKMLIVPNGSKSDYKIANPWRNFGEIEEESATIISTNVNAYGGLKSILLNGNYSLKAITELTLTGNLNANDIYLVRDTLPNLEKLDLSGANLQENRLPDYALAGEEEVNLISVVHMTLLKSVILPNSLTSIGYAAFRHCPKLASLTIPESLGEIGAAAFWNCYNLSFTINPNNKNFKLIDGVLFSSDLKTLLFYPYKKDESIYTIPEGTTTIAGAAFGVNHKLESIFFPTTLTTIKEQAFDRIDVKNIDLSKCKNLTTIDERAFDKGFGTYSSRIVSLPESIQTIGNSAFNGSGTINVPNAIVSIGDNGFSACDSLIVPPSLPHLKTIGDYAFYYAENLKSFPEMISLESIGNRTFSYSNLSSVTIPSTVKSIGYAAFTSCSKLAAINVHPDNKYFSSFNGVLFNYDQSRLVEYPAAKKTTNYIVPQTVTTIGREAFTTDYYLVSIILPDKLSTIEKSALSGLGKITSLSIPESVTKIGDSALGGCWMLKEVICKALIPPINFETGQEFQRADYEKNTILKVPLGKKEVYRSAPIWKNFGPIIEEDFSANISMKTVEKGNFSFAIKATAENTIISIDWGDGKKINYTIGKDLANLKMPISFSHDTTNIRIYGNGITYIDVKKKSLISLDVNKASELQYLYCSDNKIPIPLLPKSNKNYIEYKYAPQAVIIIPKNIAVVNKSYYTTDESLDLSKYLLAINELDSAVITTYTWKTKSGKLLLTDTDYINFSGIFNFLKEQSDSIYCEISNSAFPDFKEASTLKTNLTKIITLPNIIMKTTLKGSFSFSIKSSYQNKPISIDWGDSKIKNYTIYESNTTLPNYSGMTLTKDTTTIKIYGSGIGSLTVKDKNLIFLDISKAENLQDLDCSGNQLEALDASKNDLWYLRCYNNRLKDLKIDDLFELYCNNNKLTNLDLSDFWLLRTLFCSDNQLTILDVSKANSLKYFNCSNNQLTTLRINETANFNYLYCGSNRLTFSTLPRPSKQIAGYSYTPQAAINLPETTEQNKIIDLSNQLTVKDIDGNYQTTIYKWYNVGINSPIIEGTDYKKTEDGKFFFEKLQKGKVYCVLSNSAFPDFYSNSSLKTTFTQIVTTTGIKEQSLADEPHIYASRQTVVVRLTENMRNAKIAIYDITGRLIASKLPDNLLTEIFVKRSGVYIVRVDTGYRKMVKRVVISDMN